MNEKKYCIWFTKKKAQSHQTKANQKTSEAQEGKEALDSS
jgi:hypothetical protein